MVEENLPEKNFSIDDFKTTIKEVVYIGEDEWPDGKIVKASVEYMVVPKKMTFEISKK